MPEVKSTKRRLMMESELASDGNSGVSRHPIILQDLGALRSMTRCEVDLGKGKGDKAKSMEVAQECRFLGCVFWERDTGMTE